MQRIEVTDLQAKELQIYAERNERKLLRLFEPAPGVFIGESPRVILRALEAGYQPLSVLISGEQLARADACSGVCGDVSSGVCGDVSSGAADSLETREAAQVLAFLDAGESEIPIFTATDEVLQQITGFSLTRGMLCAMRRKNTRTSEALLADLVSPGAVQTKKRVVILENVVNPTNVGAIFRSAAALSMDAVLLSPGCSDPLYRRAIRVSMGTVFQIPWAYLPEKKAGIETEKASGTTSPKNDGAALELLKEQGFACVAMALRKDTLDLRDERLQQMEKLAIVLGTEGDGLLEETLDACDYTVKIPMADGVDSLNVAAASAVAFWELGKNRT